MIELPTHREILRAYDEMQTCEAWVLEPASRDELAETLRALDALEAPHRLPVLPRGPGNAFDGQALPAATGVVIRLTKPAFCTVGAITPRDDGWATVHVGAGVTWGALLDATLAQGWVPASIVTASSATVGGTLAAHCLSRFSALFGKEGDLVDALDVMLSDGRVLTARPDAPPGSDEAELFAAAVGGFGLVGVILSVSLRLRPLDGDAAVPVRVESTVRLLEDRPWRDLLDPIADTASRERARLAAAAADGAPPPADLSVAFGTVWFERPLDGGVRHEATLLTSRYVRSAHRHPLPLHQPELALRPFVERVMINPLVNALTQRAFFEFAHGDTFLDEPHGFTFFFDGNARAKQKARARRSPIRLLQQTFVLPDATAAASMLDTLEACVAASIAATPTLLDVLWLPRDRHDVMLSSTRAMEGFAITLSYEHEALVSASSHAAWAAYTRRLLRSLAHVCTWLGGRVHLVKSVEANTADLRAQYGDEAIARFYAARQRFDPRDLFRSAFEDRVLRALDDELDLHTDDSVAPPDDREAVPYADARFALADIADDVWIAMRARLTQAFGDDPRSDRDAYACAWPLRFSVRYDAPSRTLDVALDEVPRGTTVDAVRASLEALLGEV